jgi:hypothetical protein
MIKTYILSDKDKNMNEKLSKYKDPYVETLMNSLVIVILEENGRTTRRTQYRLTDFVKD